MAKRRGKGEGTISRRPDGRWQGRVDLGRGPDGQRRRKVVYGATRKDVAAELNRLLGRAESGELLTTSTPTVAAWLRDWHRTHQDDWRDSTRDVYRRAIEEWIVPHLGTIRLEALKPARVQRWINDLTADRPRAMAITAHVVLRAALKWAMHQRVITYNPAALVRVPRPAATRPAPLSADQARALLVAAAEHRLGAMVTIALTMGLRIGEVSGLVWSDVDLTARTLKIRQQVQVLHGPPTLAPLKTAHSRRTLTLPTLAVDALKAHRVRQLEERLKAGAAWVQTADLVFTTPTGRPVRPRYVRDVLAALMTRAGLPPLRRFHTLRHSAATLLLMDGAPLFDVSRILGHATIATTANIYGHLVDDMTAGAAARMDALLATKGGKG